MNLTPREEAELLQLVGQISDLKAMGSPYVFDAYKAFGEWIENRLQRRLEEKQAEWAAFNALIERNLTERERAERNRSRVSDLRRVA